MINFFKTDYVIRVYYKMKNLFERKQAENVFQHNYSPLEKAEALVTCYLNGAELSDVQSLIKNARVENKAEITLNEAYIEVARVLGVRNSDEASYRMQVEGNTNLLIALHESEYATIPSLVTTLGKQGDILQAPSEEHPEYVLRFSFNEAQISEHISLDRNDVISEALIQNNIQMCDDTFNSVVCDIQESESISRIATTHNLSKRTVQIMYNSYLESQGIDATICPMCEGLGVYTESYDNGYYECKSCSHQYYDTEAIQLHEKELTSCPSCPAGSLHINEHNYLSCDNCNSDFIKENNIILNVSRHLIEEFNDDEELDGEDNELDHQEMGCPECSGHVIDLGNNEYKCTACKWTGDSTAITQYDNEDDDPMDDDSDEYDEEDDMDNNSYELDDEDDEMSDRPSESLKPISIVVPINESYNCPECGAHKPQHECCGIKFLEAAEDMLIPPKNRDDESDKEKPLLDMDFSDGDEEDDDMEEMVTSSSIGSSPEMGMDDYDEMDDELDDEDDMEEMGDMEDLGELGDQGQDDLDLSDEEEDEDGVEESDDDPDFEGYLDTVDNDPDGNPDYEDHYDDMVAEDDEDGEGDDDELEEASNKMVNLRAPKPEDFV